jgi:uncharacterized protein (TIGR02246 family)
VSSQTFRPQDSLSPDEIEVCALYRQILAGWNKRSGDAFAAPFAEDGDIIGFDGSQHIFADHITPTYVGKVKSARLLAPEVAVVRAIAGLVPPGQSDLEPQLNSVQTLVATKCDGQWRIALFQNTPAQFHGRPEQVQELTEELRQLL